MKKHKQVYMEYFGFCSQDIPLCEVCGAVAVDIHHILFKSQGGTDEIENLIGLCRYDHDVAHGKVHGEVLNREDLLAITRKRL